MGNLYETKDKKDRKYKNSQLQQDRTYYYHYDVEGNLIFKEHIKDVGYRPVFSGGELRDLGIQPKSTGKGILYTWNANGSLRAVTDLQGTTYRFRYDAFGRRLEKRRMASTFRFVWDGNVLLHETFKKDNSKNTELTTWVFEGFVPTAKLVNGKAYSIISDHLGTPILAIDSDGMEVWNRQLDIYGRVRKEYKHSSLGDEVFPFVPFLYQGQYYDFETGLCYNRFRYYNPETGAYISQDPIGLAGGNPTLYGYVKDSNWWVDVLGLDCSSFNTKNNIVKRWVNILTGKNADEVENLMKKKGYEKDFPQAEFPEKTQHTTYTRTTKSGDIFVFDYHPGGTENNPNLHGNDYWKIYKIGSNGEKVVYGRIGHTDFKNFDNIKDSPVYKDSILMNKP